MLSIPMWKIIGIGEWKRLQFMGLGPWLQVAVQLSWRLCATAIAIGDLSVTGSLTSAQGVCCKQSLYPNQRDGDWVFDYVEGTNLDFALISFCLISLGRKKHGLWYWRCLTLQCGGQETSQTSKTPQMQNFIKDNALLPTLTFHVIPLQSSVLLKRNSPLGIEISCLKYVWLPYLRNTEGIPYLHIVSCDFNVLLK